MNINGWLCRHSVTSSRTSSAWEIFFMHTLHMVFPFMMSNWSYTEQVKKLKSDETFRSGRTFSSKVSSEGSYLNRIAKSTPAFWSFWSTFQLKNWRSYGNFKIWPIFFTWWPSSMTYLFVNVTYWNCWPIPYVEQVWWWYVKAFMIYAWQNWQTNRQTDRQTDKRTYLQISSKFWQVMKGQSEIAYLPKFANMMLIVMVMVITEILYIILIFDCFENQ